MYEIAICINALCFDRKNNKFKIVKIKKNKICNLFLSMVHLFTLKFFNHGELFSILTTNNSVIFLPKLLNHGHGLV